MKKFLENIIKPFFFSGDCPKVKVPYVWATVVNVLNIVAICMVLFAEKTQLIPLVGIIFAGAIGLIAMYNQGKSSGATPEVPEDAKKG